MQSEHGLFTSFNSLIFAACLAILRFLMRSQRGNKWAYRARIFSAMVAQFSVCFLPWIVKRKSSVILTKASGPNLSGWPHFQRNKSFLPFLSRCISSEPQPRLRFWISIYVQIINQKINASQNVRPSRRPSSFDVSAGIAHFAGKKPTNARVLKPDG